MKDLNNREWIEQARSERSRRFHAAMIAKRAELEMHKLPKVSRPVACHYRWTKTRKRFLKVLALAQRWKSDDPPMFI